MFQMKTVDDLYDHIGYVVLCAPDKFPVREYLSEADQMSLDKAFDQLREGLAIAYTEASFDAKRQELSTLLDQSLSAYQAGDRRTGAHLLQDFQDGIFKTK